MQQVSPACPVPCRQSIHDRASPSAPADAQLGAVSFLHRFGSALNAHFHFHVVVLDGVFFEGDDGSVIFHEAAHISADDVLRLELMLQRRVLRLFLRRGLLDEHTVEDMLTWQASGGFSLDASVRIHGSDATGREPAQVLRPAASPLSVLILTWWAEPAKGAAAAGCVEDGGAYGWGVVLKKTGTPDISLSGGGYVRTFYEDGCYIYFCDNITDGMGIIC